MGEGLTALHGACKADSANAEYAQRREVVELLLKHGASAAAVTTEGGLSPLLMCCSPRRATEPLARLLVAHGGAKLPPESLAMVLERAALHGRDDILRLLLDAGAVPPPLRQRLVWLAARHTASAELLALVLKRCAAHVDEAEPATRRCALSFAAERGRADLVRLLLDAGAAPNQAPPKEPWRTALFCASKAGHEDAVRELLRAGAKLDVGGSAAPSALGAACAESGKVGVVRLLLAAGADPRRVTEAELAEARRRHHDAAVSELLEFTAGKRRTV